MYYCFNFWFYLETKNLCGVAFYILNFEVFGMHDALPQPINENVTVTKTSAVIFLSLQVDEHKRCKYRADAGKTVAHITVSMNSD